MGGIGKTQLAAEFVHRYGQFFAGGVFWLSFAIPSNIPIEVAACGGSGHLNLHSDFVGLSLAEQVSLVLAAWRSPLPRLLIFDNCEDEAVFASWRPPSGGCHVIITSRRAEWNPALGVQVLQLDVFHRAESVTLLRRFRPELPGDDANLDAIGAVLGDLPLALHLVGSFLRTYRHASFGKPKEYLAQLDQVHILRDSSLAVEDSTFNPTGHEQNIARTFELSYERLDANHPTDMRAIALLARAAYFAPGEVIPRNLLLETLRESDSDFNIALQNEKAIARLIALGLIKEEKEGTLRMHRLLVMFVRTLSDDPTAQASVENTLLDVFRQSNTSYNLASAYQLEVHLRAVTDFVIPRGDQQTVDLCNTLGNYLRMSTDYVSAQYYLERALTIHEALLGKNHPETAIDLNDLGYVHYLQADYAQAHLYLERALPLLEQKQDYRNLAATLDNLAQLHSAQGDTTGAYKYYQRALDIREQVLGPFDNQTAITLHNIGSLLLQRGDLTGAREHFERALMIREQIFKEPNANIAVSLQGLGQVLERQCNVAGARKCYERALVIREQVLGLIHPYTLNSLASLAVILTYLQANLNQADLTTMQAYFDRLRAAPKQAKKNAITHTTLNNLGYTLWVIGDYTEALRFYKEALNRMELTRGKFHPDLSTTLNNLGMALVPLGDYTAAHEYYERALLIQEQSGQASNDLTARILNNFGVLLRIQGDLRNARAYLERALAIRTQTLGEVHRDTATTLNNLGLLLQAEGDLKGAQEAIRHALSICRQLVGDKHPDVARSLHDLGLLLQTQGELGEARICLEQALMIREKALPEHPDTAATLASLSTLALAQGEKVEAHSYLERALTINKKRLGADHAITRSIRERLAALSEPLNKT